MTEPASQHIPKPSAVSTRQLIDSEKYQELSNAEPKDAPWLDTTYDGFNEEKLKEQLEILKRKNFQSVAIACMAEYSRVYGEMPDDELWMFLEAEYYATGEGQTVCLQVTQAEPGHKDDFDKTLSYPDNNKTLTTQAYRAVRDFYENFGTWHLHGLRFHSREAFFTRYADQLPILLVKLADSSCLLEYHSELHYNFA